MKTTLLFIVLLALGSCSTSSAFYEGSINYIGQAESDSVTTVPAIVFVKGGKIKSIIVEP